MKKSKIPAIVIRRLPLYLRILEDLKLRDKHVISSGELGELTGLSPAQVRKDLAYFGEFGRQGIGYNVDFLASQLREILRLEKPVNIALVGVGHLGLALARYNMGRQMHKVTTSKSNLRVVALFDNDPEKIGTKINDVEIYDLSLLAEKVQELDLRMLIISVPAEEAQRVADMAVSAGLKAILNFAPVKLNVPYDVRLHNADLTAELQSLAYYTT